MTKSPDTSPRDLGRGSRGFRGAWRDRLRPERPKELLLIAAASLAWGFCYPPFPIGPLVFAVLAPLFVSVARLAPWQAFRYSFAAGILYNTAMYWWIYNVIKVGPALVIGSGLVVLILFLSLFNGLLGWMYRIASARPWALAAYPFLWAGLEVVRTWGQMSFPWSHAGYALGQYPSLIQAVSFLGIFGLSAAVVGANVLLAAAWRAGRGGARLGLIATALAIPALLWVHGAWSLSRPDPDAGTLDIGLVQPSIPQTKKWDENYFQEVMQKTWRTMEGGKDSSARPLAGADLIVLPETAVPDFLRSRGDVQSRLGSIARENGGDL
ncbi:MAG TPA: hypothetical protein VK465_18660, partial [Fibrobacteria bacterium]|nr:hypothetical protein [Fibrobacteria bacterium]